MVAKRKPFLTMTMEDSLKEKLRRYIHDVEYWLERARVEAGPDSDRYRTCDTTRIAYTLCLGERIMQSRMGMDSGEKFRPDLCPHVAISEGNAYLERVRLEGTPEKEEPKPFRAFTGSVDEYIEALNKHNLGCETCAPGGLPNTTEAGPLCDTGRAIRTGLSYARGRAAGQTGAML